MDIEDATFKLTNEPWREQAHVAGKTYDIHAPLVECQGHPAIVFLALMSSMVEDRCWQPHFGGPFETGSIRNIADNKRNIRASETTFPDRGSDRPHVRATTGNENPKLLHESLGCDYLGLLRSQGTEETAGTAGTTETPGTKGFGDGKPLSLGRLTISTPVRSSLHSSLRATSNSVRRA